MTDPIASHTLTFIRRITMGAHICGAMVVLAIAACTETVPRAHADGMPNRWEALDGDTVKTPWGEKLTLDGITAPQTGPRAKCVLEAGLGEIARARLQHYLDAPSVILHRLRGRTGFPRLDRLGRPLVRVYAVPADPNDVPKDISVLLVRERTAVAYDGRGRHPSWCGAELLDTGSHISAEDA